jgi:hypothetical protein
MAVDRLAKFADVGALSNPAFTTILKIKTDFGDAAPKSVA